MTRLENRDPLAVKCDCDPGSDGADLEHIPLTERVRATADRGRQPVDRAGQMQGAAEEMQIGIEPAVVDLDYVASLDPHASPDYDRTLVLGIELSSKS